MSSRHRQRLLQNLHHDTYARIAPSTIKGAGVGVIAIKTIPKGTNPFVTATNTKKRSDLVSIYEQDLHGLDKQVKKMITDYNFPEKTSKGLLYTLPRGGLNALDISFYLNHSKTPNMGVYEDTSEGYFIFRALRDIEVGEELTFDYSEYDN